MTTLVAQNFDSFIFAQGEELKTNSLKIAEAFGKRHDHVLRDIRKIIVNTAEILEAPKFGEVKYEYKNNRGNMVESSMFEMTKDGFVLVVMAYTGIDAMKIKVAYINAFNLMYDKLFPKVKPRLLSELTNAERWKMVVDRWCVFIDIYGTQLTNQYGDDIPQVWEDALGNLSTADFKRGIEAIKNSGSPYMPKLPVFIAYCKDTEVVKAKEGLAISEMKKELADRKTDDEISQLIYAQDMRIKICIDLLSGIKQSAEVIKSHLEA